MATSRPSRWWRLIAFAAALIAFAGLVAAGSVGVLRLQAERHRRSRIREETKTHRLPLLESSDNPLVASAARSLAPLRQAAGPSRDVLYFVATPSLADGYAMTIYPANDGDAAHVALIVVREDFLKRTVTVLRRYNFVVPKAEYNALTRKFDALTDDWSGETTADCLDGTPVAFERRKDALVTSGIGNAECSDHYRDVDMIVERLIIPHAPADAKIGPHWSDRSQTPDATPKSQ